MQRWWWLLWLCTAAGCGPEPVAGRLIRAGRDLQRLGVSGFAIVHADRARPEVRIYRGDGGVGVLEGEIVDPDAPQPGSYVALDWSDARLQITARAEGYDLQIDGAQPTPLNATSSMLDLPSAQASALQIIGLILPAVDDPARQAQLSDDAATAYNITFCETALDFWSERCDDVCQRARDWATDDCLILGRFWSRDVGCVESPRQCTNHFFWLSCQVCSSPG
jgi:hypothetical protein